MARPVWTGSLSFGLVHVQVALYSAVAKHDVRLHQLDRESGRRIRYRKVVEGTDEGAPPYRIVKGYEHSPGRHVLLEPDELGELAPQRSKTITITDFVQLAEIDPVYFDSAYHLGPQDGSENAYALLRQAMEETGRAAVARFVMRNREYLAVIRSRHGGLVLSTLHYADEVRSIAESVPQLPGDDQLGEREKEIARLLVEQMTVGWDPDLYHDEYRDRLVELIEAKVSGEDWVVDDEQPVAPVLDLMEALQRSLGEPADRRPATGARSAATRRSRTRKELYAEAQRLEIVGRSTMTRDELEAAVQRAS